MVLGLGMLFGALALYLHNEQEGKEAQQSVEYYLPQLMQAIDDNIIEEMADLSIDDVTVNDEEPQQMPSAPDYYSTEMTVETIDGYGFVGYLTIPSLGLQLPVLSQLDYGRLKLSPCRFYGSTKTKDLVIGAHNYTQHFGKISGMRVGDELHFTDMDGKTWSYRLIEMVTLGENDVEELTKGEFPLTLFTCTYSGERRVTLRFDIIAE